MHCRRQRLCLQLCQVDGTVTDQDASLERVGAKLMSGKGSATGLQTTK